MNKLTLTHPIIQDTREQTPWLLDHLTITEPENYEFTVVRKKLDQGDYSLDTLQHLVAIERKTLQDWVGSITWQRVRFQAELKRLRDNVQHRFIFIEASLQDVASHNYKSGVDPAVLVGSALSFEVDYGVSIWWCGSSRMAMKVAVRLFVDIERKERVMR